MGWLSRASRWVDKLGDPKAADKVESLKRAWTSSQFNDKAVYQKDPNAAAAEEARALAQMNPPAGFAWMLRLAEQGSVWAMCLVAYYYQFGVGVGADPDKSEDWYRRAFEGGSQRALLYYGFRLMRRGALREAEDVFRVGVVDDWAPAMYWFVMAKWKQSRTRKTFAEVLPLLERGSAKGSLDCELFLAIQLILGRGGLQRIPEGLRRIFNSFDVLAERIGQMKTMGAVSKPGAPTVH